MKKIWIIALIAALFMFATGYNYLKSQGSMISGTANNAKMVNAVVAVADIAPYTILTNEMFIVKQTTASAFPTNAYSAISDVVGSISTSPIYAGEVLTGSRVNKDKNAVGLSAQLTDGMRAVSIETDIEEGVANNLKVGNYVDLIYVQELEPLEEDQQKTTAGMFFTQIFGVGEPGNTQIVAENIGMNYSLIALQNIKVVALDTAIQDSVTDGTAGYASVTLEVTPADAAEIALMNGRGKIQLILRPIGDSSTVNAPRDQVLKKTQ